MFYIFDLDGTLMDTLDDLGAAVNHALAHYHFPTHEEELIRTFIGNGSKNFVLRALGAERQADFEKVYALYMEYYGEHCLDHIRPYPGVLDFVKNYAGACALLTNKPAFFAHKIVRHFGLEDCFTGILGGDNTPARKPEPDGLLKLLKDAGNPASPLMVGDDTPDILAAQAAKVPCCAILGGYGKREALLALRPDFHAESFLEFSERDSVSA
jgi:phosphoglycolate phosphatase